MGLPINRSAGAIAGVSLLGLLLSISLIACSSTKEHAMEENELPATSSIDQAESLPIGDNGQTTTVELYGINVPIGEDCGRTMVTEEPTACGMPLDTAQMRKFAFRKTRWIICQ